jgi:hypothetical protein
MMPNQSGKAARQAARQEVATIKSVEFHIKLLSSINHQYIKNGLHSLSNLAGADGVLDEHLYNDILKLLGNRNACVSDPNDSEEVARLKTAVRDYGMVITQTFPRLSSEITLETLANGVADGSIPNPANSGQHTFNLIRLGAILDACLPKLWRKA